MVILLTFTNALCTNLLKVLNAYWRPLTCQTVSMRIRQLDEMNKNHVSDDDSEDRALQLDDSTNGNSNCVIFRSDTISGGHQK